MATIYRFLIEQRQAQASGRKNGLTGSDRKGAGKKGKSSLFGGSKGGVEHNRRMRAINPIMNRVTHGYWEKGMRLGRAGIGFTRDLGDKGLKAFLGVGFIIITNFIIQTFLKLQKKNLDWGKERNLQNYKSMENGVSAIHGEYSVTTNVISGRNTFNENR